MCAVGGVPVLTIVAKTAKMDEIDKRDKETKHKETKHKETKRLKI
jgi:hypothetical protein